MRTSFNRFDIPQVGTKAGFSTRLRVFPVAIYARAPGCDLRSSGARKTSLQNCALFTYYFLKFGIGFPLLKVFIQTSKASELRHVAGRNVKDGKTKPGKQAR